MASSIMHSDMRHVVAHRLANHLCGPVQLSRPARFPGSQILCLAAQQERTEFLRIIPLVAGVAGISGVVANRLFSDIEPALMASSSQSRADVVAILMSAVLALTGLQWLSLKPKTPMSVDLVGMHTTFIDKSLPAASVEELQAAWSAIQWATQAKTMVAFQRGRCIAHLGYMAPEINPGDAVPGAICVETQARGTGTYLANLSLFPGRFEFYGYLPENLQSLIIQPCGDDGLLLIGGNRQRAFTLLDQAWISAWNDKLGVALNSCDVPNRY